MMKISAILILITATVCHADLTITASDVSVEVGQDARIPCPYLTESVDPATIEWKRIIDGQTPQRLYHFKKGDEENTFLDTHPSNVRIPNITVDADGGLIIKNATIKDNEQFGKLKCQVSVGRLRQDSKDIKFVAAILPREDATITVSAYSEGTQGFDIVPGFSQSLATCKSSVSYPAAEIAFYEEGKSLAVDGGDGLGDLFNAVDFVPSKDGLSGTSSKDLYKELEASDHQANFICNVRTVYGDKVFERNYTIPKFNVNYATTMAKFVDLKDAYLGSTVTLKCEADGFPAPTIRIKKNGVVQTSEAELSVEVTKDDDGSKYKCEAWNSDIEPDSPVESNVYTMKVLRVDTPVIEGVDISDETTQVKYGEEFSATCKSEGKPTPTVSWYKDGQMVSDSGMLTISELKFSDAGDYTCKAVNGYAKLNKTTPLSVQVNGMLRVSKETVNIKGENEETVHLDCIVRGNPKPQFTWTTNSDEEEKPEDIEMKDGNQYSSQLTIGPLSPELSEKEYVCTATSYDGATIVTTFKLPEISSGSATTAVIIVILVLVLIAAVVFAVLYNKGIICKKSEEKGEEAAEDIAVGMNNDEEDVEAGNGKATRPAEDSNEQPPVANPEEEKLMSE